jgi:hypothetical protein
MSQTPYFFVGVPLLFDSIARSLIPWVGFLRFLYERELDKTLCYLGLYVYITVIGGGDPVHNECEVA